MRLQGRRFTVMPSENKRIVLRLYEEVWNRRQLQVTNELLSPSHAIQGNHLLESGMGPEAYKLVVAGFLRGFPDLRFRVEDLVEEDGKVVTFWTMSGTHQGEFHGVPATGKKMSLEGITISKLANGRILDSIVSWDVMGLMQQLGVVGADHLPKSASAS
jgi:steroid delta-isomerase-like uncharacterized protein